jgi:hypothetical protein
LKSGDVAKSLSPFDIRPIPSSNYKKKESLELIHKKCGEAAYLDSGKVDCVGHTPHPRLFGMKYNTSLVASSFNAFHHSVVVTSVVHHYGYNLKLHNSTGILMQE